MHKTNNFLNKRFMIIIYYNIVLTLYYLELILVCSLNNYYSTLYIIDRYRLYKAIGSTMVTLPI